MAIYTTNQVRHMYVMKSASITQEGGLTVNKTDDNKIYFTFKGKGGVLRSDLIDLNKIEYVKFKNSTDYNRYLKQATVTLNTDYFEAGATSHVIAGQDYILRVKINNYMSLAEEPALLQYGIVHATKGMSDSKFYIKLALSLAKNLSRTDTPMVSIALLTSSSSTPVTALSKETDFSSTYTGVQIKEVDQTPNWVRGKVSVKPVNFEVWSSTITDDETSSEYNWGEIVYSNDSNSVVHNGTKIADMEYFYMGERGDIYRDNASRNRMYTEYMADPTQAYSTLDIHYAFTDSNESVQKSEKDILIVSTNNTILDAIYDEINGYLNPDSAPEAAE